MYSKWHWTKSIWMTGVAMLALTGCSGGGPGGSDMTPGPVAEPAVDGFTTAVAIIAATATEEAAPVDIEPIAVVLVDDQPAVTVN